MISLLSICGQYSENSYQLSPDLTDDDLHKFFSDNCGEIRRVEIRCSQGCPVPTLVSLGPGHTPNIYYATVEFHSHTAVHKALTLSTTNCKGVKLQVIVLNLVYFVLSHRCACRFLCPGFACPRSIHALPVRREFCREEFLFTIDQIS